MNVPCPKGTRFEKFLYENASDLYNLNKIYDMVKKNHDLVDVNLLRLLYLVP